MPGWVDRARFLSASTTTRCLSALEDLDAWRDAFSPRVSSCSVRKTRTGAFSPGFRLSSLCSRSESIVPAIAGAVINQKTITVMTIREYKGFFIPSLLSAGDDNDACTSVASHGDLREPSLPFRGCNIGEKKWQVNREVQNPSPKRGGHSSLTISLQIQWRIRGSRIIRHTCLTAQPVHVTFEQRPG